MVGTDQEKLVAAMEVVARTMKGTAKTIMGGESINSLTFVIEIQSIPRQRTRRSCGVEKNNMKNTAVFTDMLAVKLSSLLVSASGGHRGDGYTAIPHNWSSALILDRTFDLISIGLKTIAQSKKRFKKLLTLGALISKI